MRRLLLLAFLAIPAFAQHYEGTITTPRGPIAIEIDVDGPSKATMSVPSQELWGRPLANVVFDAATFTADDLNLPGNPHFEGKRDGDKISGAFTQGGAILTFSV